MKIQVILLGLVLSLPSMGTDKKPLTKVEATPFLRGWFLELEERGIYQFAPAKGGGAFTFRSIE
jgi:hypothetical protein